MGILRTDRVAGLGGANAIKGSVNFTGRQYAETYFDIDASTDFAFGTGDFTIECWINFTYDDSDGYYKRVYMTDGPTGNASGNFQIAIKPTDGVVNLWEDGSALDLLGSTKVTKVGWVHIAAVRSGSGSNNLKLYVNGVQDAQTTYTTSISPNSGNPRPRIGAYAKDQGGSLPGHVSNLRVSNEALYTSAFTVPTTELTKLSSTILLCFQSPSNILKEETDKTLVPIRFTTNTRFPRASRFTPNSPVGFSTTTDVGTQFGTTFDGVTTFDSQAYFVPPGGNTRERNRGRGLFGGGYTTVPSAAALNTIFLVEIQSLGNSVDFGDLNKAACWGGSMCASSTRGLHAGGTTPTNLDSIDFVTIASPSNATDFGNLTSGRGYTSAASNQTRGLVGGGRGGSPVAPLDSIDLITIATLGNASDFGDLSNVRMGGGALASPTRALFIGGTNSPATPSAFYASIDRVEIATAGDASDFGDLTAGTRHYMGCASSTTRGLIGGGSINPARVNNIEFVTIASDGNSTDFGDLLDDREHAAATSNGSRAIWAGGVSPYRNSIEFVTIATTGNAQDFGDIADQTSYAYASGTSDSHGGLS